MRVEIFTFCLAVNPGANRDLNILGATDIIPAPFAPVIIPFPAIVARLRFEKIEEGMKTIRFSIVDSDGKTIANPPDQKLNVQMASAPSLAAVTLVQIQQLQLPRFGEYEIALAVNERQEMTAPLYVVQIRLQQQPPAPSA